MERNTSNHSVNDLLVMKFGGTSMGSADRIRASAKLAAAESKRRPVAIVVSAMSKITDLLLDSLRKAETGDQAGLNANLEALAKRHIEVCPGLLSNDQQEEALAGVEALIAEFTRLATGIMMLGERPPRSVDEALSIGERLSAFLIARHLACEGTPASAINAAEVIATDENFGNAEPLMDETRARARSVLLPLLEKRIM